MHQGLKYTIAISSCISAIGLGIYYREDSWKEYMLSREQELTNKLHVKETELQTINNNEKTYFTTQIQHYENALDKLSSELHNNINIIKNTQGGFIIPEENKHILKYGIPSMEYIKFHKGYVSCYDRRNRTAKWSCEHISNNNSNTVDRVNSKFIEDDSIPEIYRAKLEDYYRSGFDRGHLVPAGNVKFSQEAMNETFLLSNISPQVGNGFNRHYWARLEQFARSLLSHYDDVYVCTGPLYLPKLNPEDNKYYIHYQMIGNPPNVSVPTHFFKSILVANPKQGTTLSDSGIDDPSIVRIANFVLPNERIHPNTPLTDFLVPLDYLNHYSGLDLWNKAYDPKPLCIDGNCKLPESDWWSKTSHPNYPIQETIENFIKSNEETFTFPETLSSIQRKEIYKTAEKYGVKTQSKTIGDKRTVVLLKENNIKEIPSTSSISTQQKE